MKIMDPNPILSACFAFCVAAFSHGSVPGSLTIPVNLSGPAISGTLTVGQTITASTGSWNQCTPSCTYTYQFYHEGSAIGGATCTAVAGSCNYTLASSDLSDRMSVTVLATNTVGSSAPVLSTPATAPVISTTVCYVSTSDGNDSNDCTTSTPGVHGPLKTIAAANAKTFAAGSSVLFKRGDVFRGQLLPPSSGTSGNPIVFDAYGTGAAPVIQGSIAAVNTADWDFVSGHIWKSHTAFPPQGLQTVTFTGNPSTAVATTSPILPSVGQGVVFTGGTLPTGITSGQGYFVTSVGGGTFQFSATPGGTPVTISNAGSGTHNLGQNGLPYHSANDVGNLIFTSGGNIAVGTTLPTLWNDQVDSELTTNAVQGQWYFNISDWKVHVYSVANPATAMPGLELAIDQDGVYFNTKSYVTVQNLNIQYHGAILASTLNSDNITFRDNTGQWFGGGNENGTNIRYGDAFAALYAASNIMVERNFLFQGYDTGPNFQLNSGKTVSNITFRNNIIQNFGQSCFSTFVDGTVSNISYYNNTCYQTGGWSQLPVNQRWGNNFVLEGTTRYGLWNDGGAAPTNYNVENNAMAGMSTATCNIEQVGSATNNAWQGGMFLDYNLWSRENGTMPSVCLVHINAHNVSISPTWIAYYTPAQEAHGIFQVDPGFTSASTGNFTPTAGSPLRNVGVNLFSAGVVWDFNRNPRPAAGNFTIGAIQ